MAQQPTRFCSNCGTPLEMGMRFCANCGAPIDSNTSMPTGSGPQTHAGSGTGFVPNTLGTAPDTGTPLMPPPPPPPNTYLPDPYTPPSSPPTPQLLPDLGYQGASGYQSPVNNVQPVPDFARPQQNKHVWRSFISLLLVIALIGIGGLITYRSFLSKKSPSQTHSGSSSANDTTNNGGHTTGDSGYGDTNGPAPSSSTAKTLTFPTPLTFIYDDIKISILDVKQAQYFSNDTDSQAQSGVLRLDLKEQNTYSSYASYYPTNDLNLLLSDGTTARPITAGKSSSLDGDVSRTNWIDFAVATNVDPSTLVLKVGKSTEAQLQVPLQAHADLSKYQPKIVNPNQKTLYGGLTWTITKAEADWSFHGKQADAGSMFVTLTFKVDNNSSADFIGSAYDYLRLQSGQTTNEATDENVPVSFPAQQTNQTGTATFIMPQGSTDFTLILRANDSIKQESTIPFQIK